MAEVFRLLLTGSQTARILDGGETDAVDCVVVAGNEAVIVIGMGSCNDAGVGPSWNDIGVQSVDRKD